MVYTVIFENILVQKVGNLQKGDKGDKGDRGERGYFSEIFSKFLAAGLDVHASGSLSIYAYFIRINPSAI
jgi:hypothetical protein